MIVVIVLIAFAIAFFPLRKSGGFWRHVLAFVLPAILALLLTAFAFDLNYRPSGETEAFRRRYDALPYYIAGGVVAAVVAPIVGMIVAMFSRRRRQRKQLDAERSA